MIALPAAVLSLCWLAAAPGKPPSAEETRLFEEGMRALEAGNPRDADQAWRAGYALGKDPAFLVRMGEAEEKAGLPAEAADSYRRYLRAAPDAADRAEIEQRLARLDPAGGTAAGTPPVAGAAETPGSFGGGAAATPSPVPAPAPGQTPAAARDDETARRATETEERGWTPFNVTAWIASGATVLLLGAAAYFAASAGSEKDDVNRLLRYQDQMTGAPLEYHTVADRYQAAIHDGQRHDRLAKEVLVAAAGTTLVATVFFILDAVVSPDEKAAPAERPHARTAPGAVPRLGFQIVPGTGAAALSSLRWTF
jgi:hypothetical protein